MKTFRVFMFFLLSMCSLLIAILVLKFVAVYAFNHPSIYPYINAFYFVYMYVCIQSRYMYAIVVRILNFILLFVCLFFVVSTHQNEIEEKYNKKTTEKITNNISNNLSLAVSVYDVAAFALHSLLLLLLLLDGFFIRLFKCSYRFLCLP